MLWKKCPCGGSMLVHLKGKLSPHEYCSKCRQKGAKKKCFVCEEEKSFRAYKVGNVTCNTCYKRAAYINDLPIYEKKYERNKIDLPEPGVVYKGNKPYKK